jgi:predicted phosphoribosyltransferase
MIFADRTDAGQQLAPLLAAYRNEHPVVLALPRGGVPVGLVVARALGAPLDVLVARKLGAPGHAELGIGAVAPGATVLDQDAIRFLRIPDSYITRAAIQETAELERRERVYREGRPPAVVEGKTIILVDDGLATGVTARAAIASLRKRHPKRIVFAAPVCAPETVARLRSEADDVVCVTCPPDFQAVGLWYRDFSPTSDAEVLSCLRQLPAPAVPV